MARPTIADLQLQIRTQASSIITLKEEAKRFESLMEVYQIQDKTKGEYATRLNIRITSQHKALLIFMNQRNLLHAMLDGMGVAVMWNNKKQSVVSRLRRKLLGS